MKIHIVDWNWVEILFLSPFGILGGAGSVQEAVRLVLPQMFAESSKIPVPNVWLAGSFHFDGCSRPLKNIRVYNKHDGL